MTASSLATRRILVTGADGFLGRGVVAALAREGVHTLVAADVREVPAERRLPGVIYLVQDVRDPALAQTLADHAIDSVVHLASIVTPGKGSTREREYAVDVGGTRNVLTACLAQGVQALRAGVHLLASGNLVEHVDQGFMGELRLLEKPLADRQAAFLHGAIEIEQGLAQLIHRVQVSQVRAFPQSGQLIQ